MNVSLAGQVAVVTGGGSGIGKAVAQRLAEAGALVVVGDVRLDSIDNAPTGPTRICGVPCDVRVEADVERLVRTAVDRGGGLDILVHSAGIVLTRQIPEVREEEWDACLDTNLKGAFLAAKHAIPHLRARGGGVIIQMASNAGLLPRAHDPVYSTSKGALIALTRSLALSHAPDRIRVNAICPGPVQDTRIIDDEVSAAADPEQLRQRIIAASPLCRALGRMVTPAEIAEAVIYLASPAAVFVTGTSLAIDGGKSLGVPPAH
ncbi:MAG: SDR family oxidoreductase [Pirellulales bacterium]